MYFSFAFHDNFHWISSIWCVEMPALDNDGRPSKDRHHQNKRTSRTKVAFLWGDLDQNQWSKTDWIMVHQRNQWIRDQSEFISSFDLRWFEWSWITDPDPDHPKRTHPNFRNKKALPLQVAPSFSILYPGLQSHTYEPGVLIHDWLHPDTWSIHSSISNEQMEKNIHFN